MSPDYHTSSPPPNFQPPNQGTPAPFYVAGAEIPANTAPAPLQTYPLRPGAGPSGPPGADQAGGRQPAPITTATSPPPQAPSQFNPYAQSNQRPTSTYGAQELATSVYDTPISPNAQNPINPAAPYSPDDPYNQPPSAPAPLAQPTPPVQGQSQYQSYQPPQGHGQGYDGAPSAPTGAPPPVPQGVGRPDSISPPPGSPYDARQGLPSQANSQPQYRPYVPPSEPSAPGPADYYR